MILALPVLATAGVLLILSRLLGLLGEWREQRIVGGGNG